MVTAQMLVHSVNFGGRSIRTAPSLRRLKVLQFRHWCVAFAKGVR